MILVDTGPLVALFDPKDGQHDRCVGILRRAREPLVGTVPVLTEAFHMLGPSSAGSDALRDFVARGGLAIWHFDGSSLEQAFELMESFSDQPMDLADASIVVAAESLGTRRVFTIDRRDFSAYRVWRGHRHHGFEVVS
jgi:hypothetical protein